MLHPGYRRGSQSAQHRVREGRVPPTDAVDRSESGQGWLPPAGRAMAHSAWLQYRLRPVAAPRFPLNCGPWPGREIPPWFAEFRIAENAFHFAWRCRWPGQTGTALDRADLCRQPPLQAIQENTAI